MQPEKLLTLRHRLIDQSNNPGSVPLWRYLVERIRVDHKNRALNSATWFINDDVTGLLCCHIDFLRTQDEFDRIEGVYANWGQDAAIDTLKQYLSTFTQGKVQHERLFHQALSQTNKPLKSRITEQTDKLDKQSQTTLIAVPSPFDNPTLWVRDFGIPPNTWNRLRKWSKISELGVILSSETFRHTHPTRSHDYFSFAYHANRDITDTARHEGGGHGKIDITLYELLRVQNCMPPDEGMAGWIGNDGRHNQPADVTIEQLTNLHLDDIYAANYLAAPRLYATLAHLSGLSTAEFIASCWQTADQTVGDTPIDRSNAYFNALIEQSSATPAQISELYTSNTDLPGPQIN